MKGIIVTLGLIVALLGVEVASSAAPTTGDGLWRLKAGAFPPQAKIVVLAPTNANAQRIFGRAHEQSYAQLGRVNGRGWYEGGTVVKRVAGAGGTTGHALVWVYLVSYFPDNATAARALADIKNPVPTALFGRLGKYGRVDRPTDGGISLAFGNLIYGNVLVEQICVAGLVASRVYGSLVTRYCSKQRNRLFAVLKQVVTHPTG